MVAKDTVGSKLEDRQYEQATYAGTELRFEIAPIADRVRKRLDELGLTLPSTDTGDAVEYARLKRFSKSSAGSRRPNGPPLRWKSSIRCLTTWVPHVSVQGHAGRLAGQTRVLRRDRAVVPGSPRCRRSPNRGDCGPATQFAFGQEGATDDSSNSVQERFVGALNDPGKGDEAVSQLEDESSFERWYRSLSNREPQEVVNGIGSGRNLQASRPSPNVLLSVVVGSMLRILAR